jgi:ATP-dependent protease ClpP protease subunit
MAGTSKGYSENQLTRNFNERAEFYRTLDEIEAKTGIDFASVIRGKNERTIEITGEITKKMLDGHLAKIRRLVEESEDDIFLDINSPGGSGQDTFEFLDTLHLELPENIRVHTVCTGRAASAATLLLFCAPGYTVTTPSAHIMIHEGKQFLNLPPSMAPRKLPLSAQVCKNIVQSLKVANAKVAHWYSQFSNMSYEEAKELMSDGDRVMSPAEAARKGLIDYVIQHGPFNPSQHMKEIAKEQQPDAKLAQQPDAKKEQEPLPAVKTPKPAPTPG